MQFSNLKLAGFKSFVEKTELTIESGLTGIVGPNGCGKSNLVEALKWVMGENSAKQMRGDAMDDVIFSGTSNRPSRNIAEVSLGLNNKDRTAPAQFNEFDELEVVRRIERESGSTYKINSKEVRARDVNLLFADQASGARSTALVGQGQVNEVILAKPTERRKLLEEAAGITGLHTRRHEAELRLRGAETNLERLEDILITLDSQIKGLRHQVRQATRYRNLNDHIRKAQAAYFLVRWGDTSKELELANVILEKSRLAVNKVTRTAGIASTQQASAASIMPKLRQNEADAAAAYQRLTLARENIEEEEKRIEIKRQEIVIRLTQIAQDIDRETNITIDCEKAINRFQQEMDSINKTETEQVVLNENASANLQNAEENFEDLDGRLSASIKVLASIEANRANHEKQQTDLIQRIARLKDEKTTLENNIAQLGTDNTKVDMLSGAKDLLERKKSKLSGLREAVNIQDAERRKSMKIYDEAKNSFQSALSEATHIEAEEKALAEILEISDPDLWPPLVDELTVRAGYESVLGTALGDDLSAPSNEAAPIHWKAASTLLDSTPLPDGCTPLSKFVTGSNVLEIRLNQIGVVEDSKDAVSIAKKLKQGQRLVTLDGGYWRWDGYTATSDATNAASIRLKQRNRLETIRDQKEISTENVLKTDQSAKNALKVYNASVARETRAREKVQEVEAEVAEALKTFENLQQEHSQQDAKLQAYQESLGHKINDLRESEAVQKTLLADIDRLPDPKVEAKQAEKLGQLTKEARSTLIHSQAIYENAQQQTASLKDRMQNIETDLISWRDRRNAAENQLKKLTEREKHLLNEQQTIAEKPDEISKQRLSLIDKLEDANKKRQIASDLLVESENKLSTADNSLKNIETELARIREEHVRAESNVEQAQHVSQALQERILDRLQCAPSELRELSTIREDVELPDLNSAEKKVERLERERENMGPVNLRAETEAQELSEQIETLTSEKQDLLKAIEKLRRGINGLNREGRQKLLASFSKVDKHFQELFTELFGGGKAHLALTEADDPLEAGIEIMASPPEKRLQNLSLLSGGEQALTALALLFAVFLTNPAPICVLDEVDAPLDDNNVDRFCTLVAELAHTLSTSFLVITHHRMTMARMDRLFGVTMGEKGVSQLVSVDLGKAIQLRETA